ncbi:hypothetical protein C8R43DRAFT_961532 [Mycena crocata]|nr:hypothetical protein C8R43DRAFT_961532 [Mycena crocata]
MCESLGLPDFMQPPSAPSAYSRSPRILPYKPTDKSTKRADCATEAAKEHDKCITEALEKQRTQNLAKMSTQRMYNALNNAEMRPPSLDQDRASATFLKYRDDLINCITGYPRDAKLETMTGLVAKRDRETLLESIRGALVDGIPTASRGLTDALLIIAEEALGVGPEETKKDAKDLENSGDSHYLKCRWLDACEEFKEGKNDGQLGEKTTIFLRRLARMRYQLFTIEVALQPTYGPATNKNLIQDMIQKRATGEVRDLVEKLVNGAVNKIKGNERASD